MSGYLNRAQLIGNLGQDPEVRNTQSGGRIVTLSIATSESWNDSRTGERVERTEWHRVVVFNEKLGELAEKYLRKGSKVFLEGMLKTRKWEDKEGVERYTTEIQLAPYNSTLIFLDRKPEGDAEPQPTEDTAAEPDAAAQSDAKPASDRRGKKAKA